MNLSRGKQTNISKQLNYFPLLCPANSAPNFTFPAYGSPVSFLKHPSEETCFQMSPTLTLVLNFWSMWTLTRQAYTPPPASGPPQLPPNMHSNPICSLHLSLWPTFTLALDQQCPSATCCRTPQVCPHSSADIPLACPLYSQPPVTAPSDVSH